MTMTRNIAFCVLVGIAAVFGGCGADPSQFAQCHFDVDQDGNTLKTSKDCNTGDSCQKFDDGPGLQGMLCNSAVNPCGPDSAATLRCKAQNKECRIISLTDGSKGTMCVVPDAICANNGACPTGTNCIALSATEKTCEGPSPTGTCLKHTDCPTTQFCDFSQNKCADDHKPTQECGIGSSSMMSGVPTPEQCNTNVCNNDLRCGCNVDKDCTDAGLTNFICSSAKTCIVNPAKDGPFVKISQKCNDPLGCRGYVFDNTAATFPASQEFAPFGSYTSVTLPYSVCALVSPPMDHAYIGPGAGRNGVPAQSSPFPNASRRYAGVQLQVCDTSTVTSDCFAGIERPGAHRYPDMVTEIKIEGLNGNTVNKVIGDLWTPVYLQKDSDMIKTSADGNINLDLVKDLGCPKL